MSGTTAISVNFHGNIVAISNVGDSRAVLGHRISSSTAGSSNGTKEEAEEKAEIEQDNNVEMPQNPGKLLAIPLSRDQTPYRKDERERVKKLGAAIMSIDQMEGHEEMHENWGDMVMGQDVDIHGDPPRVWMEGKDYPGTAFTRSIGDNLAEDVGVTAEPEMLARELTSNDQILVIASDGIFEFLTNQEVIDVCVGCESPLQACQMLVKMAYDKWLVYENRTDDITVIVCFLKCNKPPPADGAEGTTEDLVVLAKSIYGNKPVRKTPRNKNDNLMTASMAPFAVAAADLEQNGLTKVRFDQDQEENYRENESKTS
jgi:serine/threonine protein phosphatase PrpC